MSPARAVAVAALLSAGASTQAATTTGELVCIHVVPAYPFLETARSREARPLLVFVELEM